ncbi:MAG TPA: PucR family transcriptional regulator [Solirubrobacteraceae bacterium]|nr:PucR family transcriptional regulator [Solirubrobacteraceae bacterium]
MLTVGRLLSEVGLELATGHASESASVRWVHLTELADPTPWLTGGELILTTGLALDGADRQREYVERLVAHGIAGLGFGVGFTHDGLPDALLDAAREHDLPLFAVPYALPFIAITERAFAHLVSQEYAALRRSSEIQERLERLVLEERGLDAVMAMVAEAIGGSATVLDARGARIASSGPLAPEEITELAAAIGGDGTVAGALAGRALALPVVGRDRISAQAWIAGVCSATLGDFERLILQQASTVVALELMRLRIARDTERRLAGDVLAEALTGRLHPEELAARLRPFGLGEQVAVLAFATSDPVAAEPLLDVALATADVRSLVAVRGTLLCAIVDANGRDPIELAGSMRAVLASEHRTVRAAASRPASAQSLRRSFHEARCALEAVRFANGAGPDVASHENLGSFHLLLSLQDDEALRSYCDSVLAGVVDGDPDYADELLRSLDAFLEHNGHWERAAAQVFCHRHTLRYRIRRVEELTKRSLSNPQDRIEFWLALRGRELTL